MYLRWDMIHTQGPIVLDEIPSQGHNDEEDHIAAQEAFLWNGAVICTTLEKEDEENARGRPRERVDQE